MERFYHGLFLAVIFLANGFLATTSSAQEVKKPAPDGTMGEIVDDPDDSTSQRKRWRLFKSKISTFKFGAGFLYEYAGYSQDAAAKKQMELAGTPLEAAFKIRDFRVVASGKLNTKSMITWKVGLMYDGVTDQWLVRESGVMFGVPKLSGHIFVGRTKEGFSMSKVMNGYAGFTMERQMALDVIPILADGIKYLGFLPKQKLLWNIGIYNDLFSQGQGFSTYKWQFVSRVAFLPIYAPNENKIVHIGVSYRYGVPLNNQMQLRSRPEANPAPYFIDTGTFNSDYSNHFGFEAYFKSGPLLIGTEGYLQAFHSVTAGNPVFTGGDAMVSYILTGESRPYSTVGGIYGFVPVTKSIFQGGLGSWEMLIKFSTLDLTAGNLQGGSFWRITPMINWYMSKDIRLELAYGYGSLDRFGLMGTTQFFQTRIQFAFL